VYQNSLTTNRSNTHTETVRLVIRQTKPSIVISYKAPYKPTHTHRQPHKFAFTIKTYINKIYKHISTLLCMPRMKLSMLT